MAIVNKAIKVCQGIMLDKLIFKPIPSQCSKLTKTKSYNE